MKGLRDNKRVRNAASSLLFLLSGVMFFLDWWSASFIVFREGITPLELGELSDQMNSVASWLGNSTGSSLRPWIIGLLVVVWGGDYPRGCMPRSAKDIPWQRCTGSSFSICNRCGFSCRKDGYEHNGDSVFGIGFCCGWVRFSSERKKRQGGNVT